MVIVFAEGGHDFHIIFLIPLATKTARSVSKKKRVA